MKILATSVGQGDEGGNEMFIPQLVRSNRKREYDHFSPELRAQVVKAYLFDGMSHRRLDEEILHLDREYSRGYQSMGILHYLGLVNAHKGLFEGMDMETAVEELKAAGDDYTEIIRVLAEDSL